MGMPETTQRWTAVQVRALPEDGRRYETIDGELVVTPAPSLPHQVAVQLLSERLRAYVRVQEIGFLFISPADIELDPRTLVQPDLFVAPPTDGRRPRSWTEITALMLAVEVLSPSSPRWPPDGSAGSLIRHARRSRSTWSNYRRLPSTPSTQFCTYTNSASRPCRTITKPRPPGSTS